MTIDQLLDYLGQFDGSETVVIDDEDFVGEGDYVSLRHVLTPTGGVHE